MTHPIAAGTVNRYLESEVMNADPVKLVTLLYRGALDAVGAARAALAAGNVAERSRQITKAWNIVTELRNTLNYEQGGEISKRLGDLYGFVGQRLLDANAEQAEGPLLEAGRVLGTLAEAWQLVGAKSPVGHAASVGAYGQATDYKPLSVAC
jgi:flagellar protein FliS